MTTEDDFQARLDAHPHDHQTRLVFADWLQERDDDRAEGYRALGTLGKCPAYRRYEFDNIPWEWWSLTADKEPPYDSDYLPVPWFVALCRHDRAWGATDELRQFDSKDYATRRAAEDAAALAFAALEPALKIQLLGGFT